MFKIQIKNYFQNPVLISDIKKTFEITEISNLTSIVKDEKVFLFYEVKSKDKNKKLDSVICLAISKDGINFEKYNKNPIFKEKEARCSNPKLIKIKEGYLLTYKVIKTGTNKSELHGAFSKDLLKWEKRGKITLKELVMTQDYKYDKMKTALSVSGIKIVPNPVVIKQGILLAYNITQKVGKNKIYSWGLALFDKENSNRVLWRTKEPIFSSENNKIVLGGLAKLKEKWFLYYYSEIDKGISVATMDFYEDIYEDIKEEELPKLIKFEKNPILEPRTKYLWESKGVFNAGAIYEQGRVYLVYRAITEGDVSVMGLAISEDGINISERLDKPIYLPRESFELNPSSKRSYNYLSGWGHSGCEDPRIVKIEDRLFMTYIAFDGGNPPGVALTSIKADDFLNRKWNWEQAILISPPGELHKNWVLFPEKLNNKYALLHSLSPEILIEYLDNLNFDNNRHIKSYYNGISQQGFWHDWVRGAGPSPIKTDKGWLIFYHAQEMRDSGKYKLGAMLLDLKNPSLVIARSKRPVLDAENLNFGKPGIIYSCGAVIIKDKLFVYYGRNDYNLGVATANLDEFLEKLLSC